VGPGCAPEDKNNQITLLHRVNSNRWTAGYLHRALLGPDSSLRQDKDFLREAAQLEGLGTEIAELIQKHLSKLVAAESPPPSAGRHAPLGSPDAGTALASSPATASTCSRGALSFLELYTPSLRMSVLCLFSLALSLLFVFV